MWRGGKSRSSASRSSMYARAELVVPRSMPIFMLVPAYVRGRGSGSTFPPAAHGYWDMWPTSKRRGIFLSIRCFIPLLTEVLSMLGSMLVGFIRAHGSLRLVTHVRLKDRLDRP